MLIWIVGYLRLCVAVVNKLSDPTSDACNERKNYKYNCENIVIVLEKKTIIIRCIRSLYDLITFILVLCFFGNISKSTPAVTCEIMFYMQWKNARCNIFCKLHNALCCSAYFTVVIKFTLGIFSYRTCAEMSSVWMTHWSFFFKTQCKWSNLLS